MFKRTLLSAATIAAIVSFATSASAVTFQTPAGSLDPAGEGVSAQAIFTLANGSLTVQLIDLQANPKSAAQLLSGITFSESGASGSGALTTVNTGLVTTISSVDGSYPAGVSDPLTRWKAIESATTINLTTLSGGNPDRLIIGPDNGSGKYSNANASVIGDNPNVLGNATFTITIPGVTTLSSITNVIFQFGTQAGSDTFTGVLLTGGNDTATPIPAALPLFASGGGLLGFLSWRRKRKNAA